MLTTTPQGPGFLIFFQTKKEHHSFADKPSSKRKEEDEILAFIVAAYDTYHWGTDE